jgi:hypothetical protein
MTIQRATYSGVLANMQRPAPNNVTASRLSCYLHANTFNVNRVIGFMIDGVLGNQTLTILAGVSGLFTDASNTDVITTSQNITVQFIGQVGGSGSITISMLQYLGTFSPEGQPYALRIQGIPGMRTFSQLGHGGL